MLILIALLSVTSAHFTDLWDVGLMESSSKSPLDILKKNHEFSKFVDALENYPDLIDYVKHLKTDTTIFAPTNEAFDKCADHDYSSLKAILKYHIVTIKLQKEDFEDGRLVKTKLILEGLKNGPQRLKILMKDHEFYVGNDFYHTKVTFHDSKEFGKGIIYAISNLLIPPTNVRDQILISHIPTTLFTFYTALNYAELTEIVVNMEGISVFAPSDDAFASLDETILKYLFSPLGKPVLRALLLFHIIPPQDIPIYTDEISANILCYRTLLMGKTITLEKRTFPDTSVVIVNKNAHVIYSNVLCSNGVIHVIDRLLLMFDIANAEL